ncbi:MAG: hypothetical protein QOJ42_1325, partial [Acidobacteriaceae bacterium]|nr:hypothetical protein [Acidobacteriaceae bacterium]
MIGVGIRAGEPNGYRERDQPQLADGCEVDGVERVARAPQHEPQVHDSE